MFKAIMGSILALVSLASAETIIETADHLNLQDTATQTEIEQDHVWAINDLIMGTMIGAYVPLNMYARKNDCYSRFWQMGTQAVEYSTLADGTVRNRNQNILLGINLFQDTFAMYQTVKVCYVQYVVGRKTNWLEWF